MKKGWLIMCVLFIAACTPSGSFTSGEQKIIGTSATEIMRLWKIDNREDSLFLRKNASPLTQADLQTDSYRILKQRMLTTVNDTADQGVGIAAPQVGISRQLVVVQRFDKVGEPFEFYVNPRIDYYSEEKCCGPEGCLSVPDSRDSVVRSTKIVVCYMNEVSFEKMQDTVQGFTAIIFQHEVDHLNGKLFIDYKN